MLPYCFHGKNLLVSEVFNQSINQSVRIFVRVGLVWEYPWAKILTTRGLTSTTILTRGKFSHCHQSFYLSSAIYVHTVYTQNTVHSAHLHTLKLANLIVLGVVIVLTQLTVSSKFLLSILLPITYLWFYSLSFVVLLPVFFSLPVICGPSHYYLSFYSL